VFNSKKMEVAHILKQAKEQVIQRVLYKAQKKPKHKPRIELL